MRLRPRLRFEHHPTNANLEATSRRMSSKGGVLLAEGTLPP
ncbi:hypothetical protein AKJ09_08012 [Labilithrix luteola]|uniref:Uncharacterized protein n=1 Tax=Labilithrix luteola TaxID=1391654 RepID=A0A0K1Q6K9_9BACT|nr:hypothetical protein AKJ09_08012 [Labilithrix luteola]